MHHEKQVRLASRGTGLGVPENRGVPRKSTYLANNMNIRYFYTIVVQDFHSHVLPLQIILRILIYKVIANIICFVASFIAVLTKPSLENVRSSIFFLILMFQKNSSSISSLNILDKRSEIESVRLVYVLYIYLVILFFIFLFYVLLHFLSSIF